MMTMMTKKIKFKQVAEDAALALYELLYAKYSEQGEEPQAAADLANLEASEKLGLTCEEFADLVSAAL